MDSHDGFIPILAIFYAVFHPTEGTKIIHQVPEGSIISNVSAITDNSLFNFDTIKNYIIPKPQLCNKLISFKIDKFRVLGYPVNIESEDYARNSFNFNFGFVFPYDSDTTPYEPAIKRMGKMFRVLEEQSFMLSKLEKKLSFYPRSTTESGEIIIPSLIANEFNNNNTSKGLTFFTPGHSRIKKITLSSIESLIHQIYQDLNNYSECCIPLDSANSVDIKLFPILPPPINIKAYQVPIATVKLNSLVDVNWDPTMLKILPYINGINSIKRISQLADADYLLTKQCIQHLMHYGCISIADIFQFGNIYAPTNNIGNFLKLNGMAEDCQAYIVTGEEFNTAELSLENPGANLVPSTTPNGLHKTEEDEEINKSNGKTQPLKKSIKVPSKATLFFLYRSLNQGQTIKEWYIQHRKKLADIDIRRFINFGMLRGIIYRVHSYPMVGSLIKAVERKNDEEVESIIDHAIKLVGNQTRSDSNRKESFGELIRRMHRNSSNANELGDKKLLQNMVNATNLTTITGKNVRKVSFGYNVDRPNRGFQMMKPLTTDDDVSELGSELISGSENALESDDNDEEDESDDELINQLFESYDDDSEYSDDDEREDMVKLIKLLKGYQNMDSICTELCKSRNEVETMIAKLGSYSIVNS